MTDDYVSAAPPGGGISWEDHNGKLLIIEPLSLESDISTVHGPSDAVRANVFVLTGPGQGEEYMDTLIFPKLLQSQTRGQLGKKVVGRLGQGEKKPGQNAPWVIAEATADDLEKAKTYIAGRGVTTAAAPAAEPPF